MNRIRISVLILPLLLGSSRVFAQAQQTPPIAPNVKETPIPPAVTLPPPAVGTLPADIPNRPLTAAEAVRIALKYQPNITIARAAIAAQEGRTQQVRSGLLPNLTGTAGYTNVQTLSTEHGSSGGGGAGVVTGTQAGVTLRQLIFDFNHTRDLVRQSSLLESAARADLTRTQSDLVFQTKQAFYQYVENVRLVTVNADNVTNTQSQLALAQARLKSGLGLPSDVVRAETALADAATKLVTARDMATTSRINLALTMGIDPRTPIDAADSSEPPLTTNNVEGLVTTALAQRPEILQSVAQLNSAKYGVSAAKTTSAPVIAANLGLLTRGVDLPPGNDTFSVGVSLEWNFIDGGLAAGRVKEARANVDTAQAQLRNAQLGVVSDVSQAYTNLRNAEQRVVTANIEVFNANEGVRIAQGRFASGLGIFLDIIDAQSALVTARTNLTSAQFGVDQARAALARAVGAAVPPL